MFFVRHWRVMLGIGIVLLAVAGLLSYGRIGGDALLAPSPKAEKDWIASLTPFLTAVTALIGALSALIGAIAGLVKAIGGFRQPPPSG